MLVLAGSFSYTSRLSFSEESLLHSPCCFQWAVLGTLVFNHACMPDLSFSETHQTIDVVEFHVGRQKSYSTVIIDAEKESKSLGKKETTARFVRLQRGTPCIHSRTRHRLCWNQHGKHGPIGAQRPLTQVTWQVGAYWRAAATDSPHLVSSE